MDSDLKIRRRGITRFVPVIIGVLIGLSFPEAFAGEVTLITNTFLAHDNTTYEGLSVTVNGCTLTLDGEHAFSSLTLINNATVTHPAGSNGVRVVISNTLSVAAGSMIDVNGRGNEADPAFTGRSGGSHGGRGRNYIDQSIPVYGDPYYPLDLGYGGHRQSGSSPRGGGAVWIRAGDLVLNGTIRANGLNGSGSNNSGGGSGGSILIETGTLSGSGLLQANGGSHGGLAGSGGGGRIAVYYSDKTGFSPSHFESKSPSGAEWGTVFFAGARTVSVLSSFPGTVSPSGKVEIPYLSETHFLFQSESPIYLQSVHANGEVVGGPESTAYLWRNDGTWRGTLSDAAWTQRVTQEDVLDVVFSYHLIANSGPVHEGAFDITVDAVKDWVYTLWRCHDLTESAWEPVPGWTGILSETTGPLSFAVVGVEAPCAFYKVSGTPGD